MREQVLRLFALATLLIVNRADDTKYALEGRTYDSPNPQASYDSESSSSDRYRSVAANSRQGYGSDFDFGGASLGSGGYGSSHVGGLGGYSGGGLGGYSGGGIGGYSAGSHGIGYSQPQQIGYIVSHHDAYEDEGKSKGGYSSKGSKSKGYGKGRGKGKGYDYYDYDYGGYDDSLLVKQPVLVHKPVVVKKPHVAYKTVVVKAPKPKYTQPILVHKPVIYKTKEWRLVDVPKVHYTPAYITPVHDDHYYEDDKKSDKGKGGSWWGGKGKGSSWW